jgi:hypothetical protein
MQELVARTAGMIRIHHAEWLHELQIIYWGGGGGAQITGKQVARATELSTIQGLIFVSALWELVPVILLASRRFENLSTPELT